MAFSASEAAFEGFRIIRREPLSILTWSGAQLVLAIASIVLMVPAMGPIMAMQEGGGRMADPAAAMAMLGAFGRLYAILIPLMLFGYAVFGAAVYRAVLRPGDKGVGRLKLGGDELRLVGLMILTGLVYLAASVGLVVVVALLVIGLAALAHSVSPFVFIAILLVYLAMCGLMIWLGVRLSLAGPMTFAEQKIRLFASWRLTKGRFWSLFGCYLLALVFMLIVYMVSFAIYAAVGVATSGGSLTAAAMGLFRPDYSSVQAYFSPVRIINLMLSAISSAITFALMFAPAAAAYRAIVGERPDSQVQVFE